MDSANMSSATKDSDKKDLRHTLSVGNNNNNNNKGRQDRQDRQDSRLTETIASPGSPEARVACRDASRRARPSRDRRDTKGETQAGHVLHIEGDLPENAGHAKTHLLALEAEMLELKRRNEQLEATQAVADRDARTAKQSIERLRERLTTTSKKYADLKLDYKDLRHDYRRLKDSHAQLKEDRQQLTDTHTAGEAVGDLGPCLYCLRPLPQGFVSHVELDLEYQLKAALPVPQPRANGHVAHSEQQNGYAADVPDRLDPTDAPLTAQDMQHIALQNTGMMWDENSGMYYNYATGYYYHTQSGLYFDPTAQAYHHLNPTTNEYEFHSSAADWVDNNYGNGATATTAATQHAAEEEILCIRLIVQESPNAPAGTVYVVGLDGGTIGRESGHGHLIQFKEASVSRDHVEIRTWPSEDERVTQLTQQWRPAEDAEDCIATPFWLRDLGSSEGTYINDRKIPAADKSNEDSGLHRQGLFHKDTLWIGETTLLVHAHPGSQSCAVCAQSFETPTHTPANSAAGASGWTSIAAAPVQITKPGHSVQPQTTVDLPGLKTGRVDHHMEMHKRKFGLDRESRAVNPQVMPDMTYVDRAKKRRVDKPGGHWTDTWDRNAPVQSASEAKPIEATNKGFKLLHKMGWSGGGLGKVGNEGIAEPVGVRKHAPGRGLGSQR
ncbi:hypothetical protein SARC_03283 [Sphaeroforma arctica JP610]|uniref:G-patch domain-containing protein n=1 Tax=Sphaeroforma arctica JP610 TaxID=667725 RepID=A0A0L0G6C8_9EUKA|nr:hypothetical protein SARC_03283 [Sphaeroforma arctica JP610]KNC84509.1 hypothetical protein SARC_03283 [Sphaeroforma arctica JP610]|eukprot:XP_014158411.1 hypothetical protein SARC_03283 [Sphaeroforma arctica JP610]